MGGEASLENASPSFSIVVTTYNRAAIVKRCVDSCLNQTHNDFELIVVDDASTDGTIALLEAIGDPRLRVVVHEDNRGIDPSRHTGVAHARGSWIVTVDSDWELLPGALSCLAEAIAALPEGVRVVRGQLEWDDGSITPSSPPQGVVDYERHIRSLETDWGDAVNCRHRAVFERTPYSATRRGVVEAAFELTLARVEKAVYLKEVLGKGYTDAENSWVRSVDAKEVIPRLLREAPDMLWMAETVLEQHGEALERLAPSAYAVFLRLASTQAFLTGDKREGLRYGRAALRRRKLDPMIWGSIALGLLGPGAIVRGTLAHRRWMRLKARGRPQAPGA